MWALPINIDAWIKEHADALKPPVCNKLLFEEKGFIIMIVGGPNARKDYHYSDSAEFFYQLKGEMTLNIMEDESLRPIPIRAGELFLLPPRICHSPVRCPNSIGLVIEKVRDPNDTDGFKWFCEQCHHLLYEEFIHLQSIEKDLPEVFNRFYQSESLRTCQHCGTVMEKPEGT